MTVSPFTRLAYSDASPGIRRARRIGLAVIVAVTMVAAWAVGNAAADGIVVGGLNGDASVLGEQVVTSDSPLQALLAWFIGVRAADALIVGMAMLLAAFTMTTLCGPYRRGDRASIVRFLAAWVGAAAVAVVVILLLPVDAVLAAFAATLAAAATAIADATRTRTLYPLTLAGVAGAFGAWLSPLTIVAVPVLAAVLVLARRGQATDIGRWQFKGTDTLGAMFVVCMPAIATPLGWMVARLAIARDAALPPLDLPVGVFVAVGIGLVVGAVAAHDVREDEPELGHALTA